MFKNFRAIKIKESRQHIVAKYYKEGYPYDEIAELVKYHLGLDKAPSVTTIGQDVKGLIKEWQEERITDIEDLVTAELARISRVENEAWEAWGRSKEDYRLKTTKTSDDGMELTEKEYKGLGDPKYMDIILKCGAERRKLLGLDKPEKKQIEVVERFTFIEKMHNDGNN